MSFSVNDRVEFISQHDGAPAGACGTIEFVYEHNPGHYKIRVTHKGPECESLPMPFSVMLVPDSKLKSCHC